MYLLLAAECEIHRVSYGPTDRVFFLPFSFMAQERNTRAIKTRKGKKRGPITCRTDRANEAKKVCIKYMALLIIPGKEQNNSTF